LVLFFLPSVLLAESASMETLWLVDFDRTAGTEIETIKAYKKARQFLDFSKSLSSDCTRYASVLLTTTTQTQNDLLVGLIGQGKVHRLLDSFTVRNSVGEIYTKHVHYKFPEGWQDYKVKVTTP